MWVRFLILFGLSLVLMGCQNEPLVTLNTKGEAETQLEANQYHVQVTFRAMGESSQNAAASLSEKLEPFEAWTKEQAFLLDAGRHDNRPNYHYHPQDGRQLRGYEASQVMNIRSLSFDDYQRVISHVPTFKSDTISLVSVNAGEAQKQQAKSNLMNAAFSKAQIKAESMARAANLCDLRVILMEENVPSHGGPRMMKMEMASSSIHDTQSQETLSLALNVQWQAIACE